jgi:hypothetical protein
VTCNRHAKFDAGVQLFPSARIREAAAMARSEIGMIIASLDTMMDFRFGANRHGASW